MAREATLDDAFGCKHCWPSTAAAAWQAMDTFERQVRLIDESHFSATILACPTCTQRFIVVFTESIDWLDGDDPQQWTLSPITETESVALARAGSALTESDLEAIGPGRRSLCFDRPEGTDASCYWSIGIMVGPHD